MNRLEALERIAACAKEVDEAFSRDAPMMLLDPGIVAERKLEALRDAVDAIVHATTECPHIGPLIIAAPQGFGGYLAGAASAYWCAACGSLGIVRDEHTGWHRPMISPEAPVSGAQGAQGPR